STTGTASGHLRRRQRKPKTAKKTKYKVSVDYDYKLIACVVLLAGFGLIVLYSSSYYSEGGSLFLKQGIFTVAGMILMFLLANFDYHSFRRIAIPMYIFSLGTTLLVLTKLGLEINGARRWIDLKVTTFQPAEFVKLALILAVAGILSTYWNKLNKRSLNIALLIVMLIPAGITFFITDNMSSAMILLVIAYGMIYLAHPQDRLWLLAAILVLLLAALLIFYIVKIKAYDPDESFRYTRIRIWFDPFNDEYANSYQVRQGLYGIATGGLFGRGLGNSILKQGFLPEPYNDMIFAVLCEEMGLFGAGMVLFLFMYLVVRIFRIGMSAPDKFGFLICMGVMLHLASQVILNILVVTNTIMNTGITLCFFSGGGSSLVFIYMEMGLVLSVAKRMQRA
ncbi:MAG: FtsW/RodA/SpoVE family cell cycle protein, partial [Lachnospiraceae bacterium]|nr:FtsW/RodA/SpoVE family cell cycle protein [Lachnospiraceae bacterium]